MKIRTKLILLLSAALIVTMLVSTWLRIRWTQRRLEAQLSESAQDTAIAIANELTRKLRSDMDLDEIQEQLKDEQRRHPGGDLVLNLDTDEDTVSSFALGQSMEDAKVDKKPRQVTKRSPLQRREEARRAYYDHGESTRAPGQRMVEPLWRTSDKPDPSDRWPLRSAQAAPHKPAMKVSTQGTPGKIIVTVSARVDPEGPMHGELVLTKSDEPVSAVVRAEEISSTLITGSAVLLLMLLTAYIVNRVVGRPVSLLE